MKMIRACLALAAASTAAVAYAQGAAAPAAPAPVIALGDVTSAGTGCPDGTVTTVLNQDAHALLVVFDSFVATTVAGQSIARLSCSLVMPVAVPDGYSISVYPIDLFGSRTLAAGINANVSLSNFFAGAQGTAVEMNFSGDSGPFLIRETLPAEGVWSPCGADVNLRTNATLTVIGGGGTIRIDAGLGYRFAMRAC